MADQPITGLPTKTASGVATTDKMLGIDSAEGYQILVQDVAKYIVENYGGSTLAGAARTPKAAIDLLNSNIVTIPSHAANNGNGRLTYFPAVIDFDTLTNEYVLCKGTHSPDGANNTFWYVHTFAYVLNDNKTVSAGKQIAYSYYNSEDIYQRICSSGTWESWKKIPTRSEFETLNSNTYNLRDTRDIPSNADMNTYKTEGMYVASNNAASTVSHSPVNIAFKMIVERVLNSASNWFRQTIIVGNAIDIVYTRYTVDNGSTWSAWTQEPRRADVDALNSKQTLVSVSKYSTEGGIVLDTSPSTSRPFGILMIGYEGMTHFKVVADSVEKTGTIGTDPGYYDSETHSFKSNNSNREITIIAPSNMANLS